jgi:hypothetical protein
MMSLVKLSSKSFFIIYSQICTIFTDFIYRNKNRQRFEVALHTLELAKTRYYVSWAGILLGIAAIVIGSVLYSIKETRWQYGIVADGGSSHTSFILFNWPENYQTGINQITECSVQEGGIDQVGIEPRSLIRVG